ncbi:CYTH and CHAD domain-containing protein [Mycolicibacterium phlei]
MGKSGGGASRHLEVERKFDVVESTVAPSFDGLSSVSRVERLPVQQLEAVYYDTPGRDLAARRVTLRRRTGGPDDGWHLKLPAGPDARTEVHAPLSAEVPESLRDIVLAIVRDRPLEPVARIQNRRTVDVILGADGSPVAEFCDDQVSAVRLPDGEEQTWREWEIELVGGADRELLDRLSNRLLDAGAQPAATGSKLARVLAVEPPSLPEEPVRRAVAEHLEELIAWDRAVRADVDDAVHQMRVATRKIRSLLQSAGTPDDAWVLDELRQLAAILGVARDAEVLAERYAAALDALAPELVRGPVRERLVEGARRRYETGLRRALLAMRSQRYFRLLDALETLVAAPAVGGEASESATIEAAYKRVRKAARAAARADSGKDEALHRIRKGAKRLRYTAAATGADKVSERAKAVQTLLGDYQDSVVSRTHLSQQAEAAHAAGEDTFTYGVLYRREEELGERARAQLDRALKKLDKAVRRAR